MNWICSRLTLCMMVGLSALAQGENLTVVPVEKEPFHKTVFENGLTRVLDVVFKPGDISLYHSHSRDNIPVIIRGGLVSEQRLGGELHTVSAVSGQTWFSAAPYDHQVGNAGTSTVHLIDVEIIPQAISDGAPLLSALKNHELVVDKHQVHVYRQNLQTGSDEHSHAGAVLLVVTSGRMQVLLPDGSERELAEGDFQWYEGGELLRRRVLGDQPVQLVEVEWPI